MLLLLDVDVSSPDEKSVITYVSSLYDAFPKVPEGGEGISANVSIDVSFLWPADTGMTSSLNSLRVSDSLQFFNVRDAQQKLLCCLINCYYQCTSESLWERWSKKFLLVQKFLKTQCIVLF